MEFKLSIMLLTIGLWLGILLTLEAGRWLGVRHRQRQPAGASGLGAVEGAVFALLGLILAFSFSGALGRFDARRHLIVEETNAIGTAYLRLDILPPEIRSRLQADFRRYVASRLEIYRKLPDIAAAREALARSNELQADIWQEAVAASRETGSPVAVVLLPALNQMIDVTTTRTIAAQTHPPAVVFAMLFAVSLVGSLLAGYSMAGAGPRSWLHILAFTITLAITISVVCDLEYPRLGFIRVDAFDQALVELGQSMK